MRIEPKDFQDNAVLRLTEEIESARREIERGRPQAVVLSSPTGSGKTVIMTLLMERLWAGHESIAADPEAIFLWISDSPELNIQSKEKIEAASDVFPALAADHHRQRFQPRTARTRIYLFPEHAETWRFQPADQAGRRADMDDLADHREYGQGVARALQSYCG